VLAAAPVLVGAMGGSAYGSVIYTSVNGGGGLTINGGFPRNIYFDVNGRSAGNSYQAGDDFRLFFQLYQTQKPAITSVGGDNKILLTGLTSNYTAKLAYGTIINTSSHFSSSIPYIENRGMGAWPAPSSGYLGLELANGDFGWANITYNGTALTLYGFAYNNTGGPITAGEVPEPTAAGIIGALVAGSAGAYAARQKRKMAKNAA
jgi:hypothetical protein